MSDNTDQLKQRAGVALLLAIAIAAVMGACVLALWSGAQSTTRTITLEVAAKRIAARADSARLRAMAYIDSGHWKGLTSPGHFRTVHLNRSPTDTVRTDIARSAWLTLVLRGTATGPTGVRNTRAHADRRTIVPLIAPFRFPGAALTGNRTWIVDAGATVDLPAAIGHEHLCRIRPGVVSIARDSLPAAIDSIRLPIVDPDTLRDSLVGAYRLATGQLRTPLRARGMVVVDSDFTLQADLRLTGALVARGALRPAGGHLDLVGAVITGDAFGSASALGPGDRVRYDACAVRRAVDLVTSRGPTATWVSLSLH